MQASHRIGLYRLSRGLSNRDPFAGGPSSRLEHRAKWPQCGIQPAFLTTRRSKHAIRPPGLRCACLPCSTYCSSTPARAKRLAPRPDGPLTHFASPRGEKCRLATRVGAVTARVFPFTSRENRGKSDYLRRLRRRSVDEVRRSMEGVETSTPAAYEGAAGYDGLLFCTLRISG